MVKIRHYITVILFTIGLILSIGGFMLDKADKVPFVLKIAAPDYSDGLKGFDELMNRGPCIKEGDEGFSTLAKITLSATIKGNISNVKIVKICREGATSIFGNTVKNGAILKITINEEQTVEGVGYGPLEYIFSGDLMKQSSCIKEGDKDYSIVANITLSAMGENTSNIKIVKICRGGTTLNFDKNLKGGVALEIAMNKEQTFDWYSFELEPLLKNLGEQTLLVASGVIFVLGIILNIISFIIESRKDKMRKIEFRILI